jgi:cytosine/adenosine deaminase-related metal-dependent hydrolase
VFGALLVSIAANVGDDRLGEPLKIGRSDRKHRVRVTRRGPDRGKPEQRLIEIRRVLYGVPDRRHASDRIAQRRLDPLGRGESDRSPDEALDLPPVDPMPAAREHEQRPSVPAENDGLHDLRDVGADRRGRVRARPRRTGEFANLDGESAGSQRLLDSVRSRVHSIRRGSPGPLHMPEDSPIAGEPVIVEGAILDADGSRSAYARIENGRVVETGAIGTDSTHGRIRRIRGIVLPPPVNSHTHLGDAAYDREPPYGPVSKVLGPPDGAKFRFLETASGSRKRNGMRSMLELMQREGQAALADFREEGIDGVRLLRSAARGLRIRVLVLGRPRARPVDRAELEAILRLADGIGLSSSREEPEPVRQAVAAACRRLGKRYALHASEDRREPVDRYLSPKPDLLVHLTCATADDLATVAAHRVPVAVCPRSNAMFGRFADLDRFRRAGVRTLLGTDNAMLQTPSIFRELEFAYSASRLRRRPVPPDFLFRAAFVEPWNWLGEPDRAHVREGSEGALVLRRPPDDPAYQVVARSTEQLIVPAVGR